MILIPQRHPPSPEHEDSEQVNDFYREQIAASYKNITAILGILNRYAPKIAAEGEAFGIEIKEIDEVDAGKKAKEFHPDDPEAVLRIKKYTVDNKNTQPWLYNKEYDTYGIESVFLRSLLYKFNIICQHEVECNEELRKQIRVVFSILVRQQFAIETSLQRLNEDELGVIIIGAMHIPTMRQYLEENHPNTTVTTIIPKFH